MIMNWYGIELFSVHTITSFVSLYKHVSIICTIVIYLAKSSNDTKTPGITLKHFKNWLRF